MASWEDTFTEQLGEDIFIDQQQLAESHLTRRLFGQILRATRVAPDVIPNTGQGAGQ